MRAIRVGVVLLVLAVATAAFAATRAVGITSADGVVLKGSYYDPGRPGPAMLLVHQCNMDRTSWQSLASSLAGAGIHVLTFDLRGFGETPGEGLVSRESFPRLMQQSRVTEHGLPMFAKNPDLEPAIVAWLETQLLSD